MTRPRQRVVSSTSAAAAVLLLLAVLVCFAPQVAIAANDDDYCHTAVEELKGYEQVRAVLPPLT